MVANVRLTRPADKKGTKRCLATLPRMRPEDHPAERTAHLVGRQWTALVVHHLQDGPLRHGELLARMCGISQKTLTERLRELERHEAVRRDVLAGSVPGTSYSLTTRGQQLARLLSELADWGALTLPPAPIAPPRAATKHPATLRVRTRDRRL